MFALVNTTTSPDVVVDAVLTAPAGSLDPAGDIDLLPGVSRSQFLAYVSTLRALVVAHPNVLPLYLGAVSASRMAAYQALFLARARDGTALQVGMFTTTPFTIGGALPQADLTRLVDATNEDAFRRLCAAAVNQLFGLVNIAGASFTYKLQPQPFDELADPGSGARRHASGKVLLVTFQYSVPGCSPSNARTCDPLTLNPHLLASLRFQLELAALTFSITPHTPCYSLHSGFDTVCLQRVTNRAYAQARTLGRSVANATALARNSYMALLRCGVTGIAASGLCVDPDATALEADLLPQATDAAASASVLYETEASSSGGGSAASFLPIAAAAGGVLLVVIIVVVIVVARRRKRAAAQKEAEEAAIPRFRQSFASRAPTDDYAEHAAFANPMCVSACCRFIFGN
jgi:hypothetical protein